MSTFGTRLKGLRKEKNLTQEAMANQINEQFDAKINKGMLSKWENGKEEASMANMRVLSQYFNTSLDYLLGIEQSETQDWTATPELTEKDQKDIAKDLQAYREHLSSAEGLMFDGEPASEEAIQSILDSLELGLEIAKKRNKEKYTPKKYRK
ncbi:helix-turn-helix domain-containing protein [Eubacterium sp.]|uniref:helix-turn-helix domain-containing protein n=1 Tax=Eubacterium sp. TaxID=142586 RepID=UPI002FC73926